MHGQRIERPERGCCESHQLTNDKVVNTTQNLDSTSSSMRGSEMLRILRGSGRGLREPGEDLADNLGLMGGKAVEIV